MDALNFQKEKQDCENIKPEDSNTMKTTKPNGKYNNEATLILMQG